MTLPTDRRRVLVTGGASGLGAATVARFHADGDLVAALDLDADGLQSAELPADVRVLADVAIEHDLRRAVSEAAEELGGLDILVACAGVSAGGTVANTAPEDWDRVFDVNVRGLFLSAQIALPHLRREGGGVIVSVASQLGVVAAPNTAAYCASKAAVIHLTRAMAVDHSAEGIRVNCVCPGPATTPMLERRFARASDPAAERLRFLETQLNGRFTDPAEIAHAIAYLASPLASSTIGAVLLVDGGYTIQ